jgi:exosortase
VAARRQEADTTSARAEAPAGDWSIGRAFVALALVGGAILAWGEPWLDVLYIARRDNEATHIFLVPFVVGWIVWTRRNQIKRLLPQSSYLGPLLLLAGWGISFFGYQTQIQALWHGGAVLMALGALGTVVGPQVLLAAAPAVIALGFLVPVPVTLRQQVAQPLQTMTAGAAQGLCELFAMPVERSGNVLVYNDVRVAVAEACNGMRMVFALFLVAYTFAFVFPLRPAAKVLVLLTSPLLAVVCNVIRLVPTVWVYGHYPDSIAPLFHDLNGWAMLVVAFLLLEGAVRLMGWLQIPVYQPLRGAYA